MSNTLHQKMYLTIRQAVELGYWPSESGLRWIVFRSQSNGFDKVIRRIGGRILLNQDALKKWVDSHVT